jgi:hypothetical protein
MSASPKFPNEKYHCRTLPRPRPRFQGAPGFVVSADLAGLLAAYPTRFLTGFAASLQDVLRDVFLAVLSL